MARIDLASFIAAANICDEPVALAAGGNEPRYRSDGVFSEGDDPASVFESLCTTMNAMLRDSGGKLALDVLRNDLGSPVADLTEADVMSGFTWLQTPPIDQTFNVIRGQFVDPSDASLYQPIDYPDVVLASPDGIERSKPMNFAMVQSASQAQRLAKTYLQRAQYPGTFSADFLASAWRCQVGSVVRLTFPALAFSNKLFRVTEHSIQLDGRCPMVLREENAAIYAWSASEAPAVTAAAPISYNPLNDPVRQAVADALTLAAARGKVWTTATIPSSAESNPGDTWVAPDGTFYDRANNGGILLGGFAVTLNGYHPQLIWIQSANQPVVEAGKTATWTGISGALKPEDNADVTSAISGLALVEINADYTGAITASLPRSVGYQLIRNGANVTTSSTWSVTVVSGTIGATIGAATGILSLDLSGGVLNDAVLTITAVYGATTRSFTVKVNKLLAPAPTSGAGGSGAGGSASASISGTSGSSTMTAVGPELTVTTGSGGSVGLSASYSFDTATGSGANFSLNAQWYRWNGSAYVAIGSAVAATSPYSRFAGEPGEPGYGECSASVSGLGASTSQKFQLFAQNAGSSVGTARRIYGFASAVAS